MSSTIINFIVENYLSNFIEINPNQTKASIWGGEVEMSNVKIKRELFKTMNIPFFEVVHGYIGSIKIKMSMPMFYKYPIKVIIDKVFFHARQKDINEINKEEEIKNMEDYKFSTLETQELIKSQMNQMNKEEEIGMTKQIMSNLYIEINEILLRYDDNVSYKKIPYSLGMIIKKISLCSTKSDFQLLSDPYEIVKYENINYKKILIKNFSLYWDCFNNEEELKYKNFIEKTQYKNIANEIKMYLGQQLDFYTYCLSEINIHSNNPNSHQYILNNISLELKATINDNINKNLKPEYIGDLDFPCIIIDFSLKQIESMLKVLSYMNLSSLYSKGLSKEFYTKKLTDEQKKFYVKEYVNYFHSKYELKEKIEFPESLKKLEEGISLLQIQLMRSASLKKSDFIKEKAEIEKKLKTEDGRYFFRDENLINQLKEQLKILQNTEEEYNKSIMVELENKDNEQVEIIDYLMNLPDKYLRYVGKFRMKKLKLIIHEEIPQIRTKDKIIDIEFVNFFLEGDLYKKGMAVKMTLEDTIIKQDKIKNPNYSTILFGDINSKGKILDIEFIMDPSLECSDMKFIMKAERGIYIICDLYVIQYIQYKIMKVLSTSINFIEIANYAKDSVSQYIQSEYANNFLKGNYQHTNIYLDIIFNSPVIILPLNIFNYKNTNCIKLSLGKFKGYSKLPPRMKPEIDYTKINDESRLFDIYQFDLQGGIMSTVKNCTVNNGYHGEDSELIKQFDMSIICNILIATKNKLFPNVKINIKIPTFDFQIDELQILYFIDYLGNMNRGNNKLAKEFQDNSNTLVDQEKKEIENFIKKKSGEINYQNENMKHIKNSVLKFDQSAKKQRLSNRYKQFVKSYSTLYKKSKLLNSFDVFEQGKKTLVVIIEFNVVKFTIKKNFTDFKSEVYLLYEQKVLEIQYMIIESGDILISLLINDVGLYDKDMKEIENKIIENENNIINTESKVNKEKIISDKFTCLIESTNTKLKESDINLIDNERKAGKKFYIKKEGFIFISYIYRAEMEDTTINIDINNLNITISLDSLTRMYQFSMYYLEKYQNMLEATNIQEKNPKNVSPEYQEEYIKVIKQIQKSKTQNKEKIINKGFGEGLKEDMKNKIENFMKNIKNEKKNQNDDALTKWIKKTKDEKTEKIIKKENIKNTMKIKVTMKNTIFRVPVYPKNDTSPIFVLHFDMIYDQNWVNEYENIYSLPNKNILEVNYFVQDSKMNLIINQFSLNLIFPSNKRTFFRSDKMLDDMRLFIQVSMNIIPNLEQSLIITDIILEPLLINLSVKQFVYLMEFYSMSMKFLYYDMVEQYIPLMKPEYLEKGIPKRKKIGFKQCFKRIVLAKKIQNIMKNNLKILKKETGKKIENTNTATFNSYIECNVKVEKVCFTFFDTTGHSRMSLFNSDFANLYVKFLSNSKIRDKKNMENAIIDMITATEKPIEEYKINNLAMYLVVNFVFRTNYHNTSLGEFEPLIERTKFKILMYQVSSFMRSKCIVKVDDMINFNLSSNGVKALNLFMLNYTEESEILEEYKKISKKIKEIMKEQKIEEPVNKIIPRFNPSQNRGIQGNKEGAVITMLNFTGVELSFSFETNPKYKITMKPKEVMVFSKEDLKSARGLQNRNLSSNVNTLRVSILNSAVIKGVKFNHNNSVQYKLKVKKNNVQYNIYFQVQVKTQGVIKRIIFTSSLSVYNDTNYQDLFLMINNKNIERNTIKIPIGQRRYIPISWFLCQTPESEIRLKVEENGEEYLVFYHISEIISEPIDKKKKDENLKKIQKKLKNFENSKNFQIQSIIQKIKNDSANLNKSKILEIKDEEFASNEVYKNKKKYLCFDYYIYQSKSINLEEKEEEDNNQIKYQNYLRRTITTISERFSPENFEVEFSYEYFIYIRPSMTFINSLPFKLNLFINDFRKFSLETNQKQNISDLTPDVLKNEQLCLKLILEYYNKRYKSDYKIPDKELTEIELYEELNEYAERKNFNMAKLTKDIELEANIKNTLNFKGFSCASFDIIFYSDFIINNRLPYTLWCISCDKKGIDNVKKDLIGMRERRLNNNSINIMTLTNNEDKFIIRSQDSKWSKPFDINSVGVNGVITIDDQVDSIRNQVITKSKDIACLISKSKKYPKSTLIILEQKYLLINHLGFDIYYKQEKDIDILLKDKTEKELFYKEKKKVYRLGLFNSDEKLFCYSQPFSVENVADVDLYIRLGQNDIPKYIKFKNNIYTNNNKDHYVLLRIINKSYDDGTCYLLIYLPIFPFLEISNRTDAPVTIHETKNVKNPLVIQPHLNERNKFPLVWKNTAEPKDNLYFEIYGYKQIFSFSKLENEIITLNNKNTKEIKNGEKYIQFKIYRKNKGMTRSIKIKEISKEKNDKKKFLSKVFILNKKRPTSSLYKVELKGIGLSFINEVPKELFYISFYDIKINYLSNFFKKNLNTKTEITENIELYIKNFQIDYCLNDSFKNIITPLNKMTPQIEAELEANGKEDKIENFVPFLSMLVTRQTFKDDKKNEEISFYKQVDLVIQEFIIKVEQYALTSLLDLTSEIMGFFDYSTKLEDKKKEKEEVEKILETKVDTPLDKLLKENEDLERMTINILMLGCLKFSVTVRLDLSQLDIGILPKPVIRTLGSVGNSLARITDGQLKFSEKIFTNIYKNTMDIMWELINHYSSEGIRQIYKILGSTDLLGNPANFIEGLGTGFFELVNEPRKGFLLGPKQFGKGLLKGLGGVLSGVVGGAFGVVQRVSGTLYSATQSMLGTSREYIIEEEDEPTNIVSGIGRGLYGGVKELFAGITGIFTYPYKKYKQRKTVKSLVKGIGTGLFRLIISPFAAIFKIIYSVSTGAKNTIITISGKKILVITRFRHPRVMIRGDEPIHCYEEVASEAKELLWRLLKLDTDYILYSKYFVSGDKGFNSLTKNSEHKLCMVIITYKNIYVIYNLIKVIFDLKIKSIQNCSVHFEDNKYILAFRLIDGITKGFRLESNCSDIASQIYDMFSKMDLGKRIRAVMTIRAEPGLYTSKKPLEEEKNLEKEKIDINKIENEEEKIDKSSYNKTLVDNDSVITFENNKKIDLDEINFEHNNNKNFDMLNSNLINTKSSRIELNKNDINLDIKNWK